MRPYILYQTAAAASPSKEPDDGNHENRFSSPAGERLPSMQDNAFVYGKKELERKVKVKTQDSRLKDVIPTLVW